MYLLKIVRRLEKTKIYQVNMRISNSKLKHSKQEKTYTRIIPTEYN